MDNHSAPCCRHIRLLHLLHRLHGLECCPEGRCGAWGVQERYGFKAKVYQAAGFASKQEYQQVHGSDLFLVDIEKYDHICKVHPDPLTSTAS